MEFVDVSVHSFVGRFWFFVRSGPFVDFQLDCQDLVLVAPLLRHDVLMCGRHERQPPGDP